jgi:hypothetical protein
VKINTSRLSPRPRPRPSGHSPSWRVLEVEIAGHAELLRRVFSTLIVAGPDVLKAGVAGRVRVAHLPISHEPLRPHPQRLPDQMPQTDLAGSLQTRLPGLHANDIGQRDLQFEDLFAGDDPLARRALRRSDS